MADKPVIKKEGGNSDEGEEHEGINDDDWGGMMVT